MKTVSISRKSVFLSSLFLFLLTACSDNKIPLEGKRISLFKGNDKKTIRKSKRTITIPKVVTYASWHRDAQNAQNLIGNMFLKGTHIQQDINLGQGKEDGKPYTTSIVVDKGILYSLDNDGILKAIKKGDTLYESPLYKNDDLVEKLIGSGVTYHKGHLYIATSIGDLLKVEAASGRQVWRHNIGVTFRSQPLVHKDKIYLASSQNQLFAFDTKKGAIQWDHSGITQTTSHLSGLTLAIAKDRLIVSYSSGEVYGLNPQNGDTLWVTTMPMSDRFDGAQVKGLPVIHQNSIYMSNSSGYTFSLNLEDGSEIWSVNEGSHHTPLLIGDTLFILNEKNKLMSLSEKTGKQVWQHALGVKNEDGDRLSFTSPIMVNGQILLLDNHEMAWMLDAKSGKMLKKWSYDAVSSFMPKVVNGQLYIQTNDGDLKIFG